MHVEPVPADVAADRLRRQLARLESGRRADAAKGRLGDPDVEVAAEDARELAAGLARGEQKLFRVGLYLTVHAAQREGARRRVRPGAGGVLLDAARRPAGHLAHPAGLGLDPAGRRRRPRPAAQLRHRRPRRRRSRSPRPSCPPPAASSTAPPPTASGLVLWDRFAQDNHNSVILARSGAGKTYLAKLEALRSLYAGIEVAVVDPEDEYRRLAETVGGAYVHLGAPGVRVNPFDLAPDPTPSPAGRCSSTPSSPCCSAGNPTRRRPPRWTGGSSPPTSRSGSPPTPAATPAPRRCSRDLAAALDADGDPAARTLAARLAPFITGTHRGLFDGPTTTRPDGHLVVFSPPRPARRAEGGRHAAHPRRHLAASGRPDQPQAPAGDRRRGVAAHVRAVRRRVPLPHGQVGPQALVRAHRGHPRRRRPARARPLGQAVVANAATQILLRQAPQSIDTLAEAFGLSAGERAYLLGAARGQGLLAAGVDRVAFTALASPEEDDVCRTGIEQALDDTPDL